MMSRLHVFLLPVVLGAPTGSCLLQSGTRLTSQGQSASVQASSLLVDFATSHASVLGEAIKANVGVSGECKLCYEDEVNEQKICIEKKNCDGVGGNAKCSAPMARMENFIYPWMMCNKDKGCLNDNKPFGSWDEAWEACGNNPECGAIMKWDSGDPYYLRRADDPFFPWPQHKRGREIGVMFYNCRETCPPPGQPADGTSFVSSPYRGCLNNQCLDDNREYDTFDEAWEACGLNQQCGFVSQYDKSGAKFYLRRLEDPIYVRHQAGSLIYSCPGPSVEEYEGGATNQR